MIIWISSFPKSGNTWLRAIISSLIYSEDGIFNFKYLDKINQFPRKRHFEGLTENFDDLSEIKKFWLLAQDRLNLDNKIKFLKTHQINCSIDGYPFTNSENTAGTIYIVRDPRNLINSISNHFSKTPEEAKDLLFGKEMLFDKNIEDDVITLIGSWKDHFNFWKNSNCLLLKYEDLVDNPEKQLNIIIEYLKKLIDFKINKKKIDNILRSTSFQSLEKLENNQEFAEAAISKDLKSKVKFFYKGPSNCYKKDLDNKIRLDIENAFNQEMKELGYL